MTRVNLEFTPEKYGAKGDGVTNDQAAFVAMFAAMAVAIAAGNGAAAILGARTYLVTGGLSLSAGSALFGQGDSSVIRNATDSSTLVVAGQSCNLQNFKILASGGGASQDGIAVGPYGLVGGPPRTRVVNVTVEGAGRAGIFVAPNTIDGYQHGPLIQGCRVTGCGYGIWLQGEYNRVVACDAYANTTGIYIPAGNNIVTSCTVTANTTGVHIVGGGNDGHGIVSACDINHNMTNLRADFAVANGMPFVGCNFYGTGTSISLISSRGIRFVGCAIDVDDYFFDGSQETVFQDCLFPDSYNNTIHNDYNGHASHTIWGPENVGLASTGSQLDFTFSADADQTLSFIESTKRYVLIEDGVITLPRVITSLLGINEGQTVFVRNLNGVAITWKWSATDAGVSIASNTSALIGVRAGAAVKIMAGT